MTRQVAVIGAFDDIRSRQFRFLEEASRFGELNMLLWSDELVQRFEGRAPKFPVAERRYFLEAVRFVARVELVSEAGRDTLPPSATVKPDLWIVPESESNEARRISSEARGIAYQILRDRDLQGFPNLALPPSSTHPGRKKVVVTGCYDWFHSGHVRFFEEVSAYGELYVVVGNDANIRFLKGEGHPLVPQDERRYVVGCIRYVTQSLITSGQGWLDADPEIQRLKPDIYAVNEDGDKGGKREYCAERGMQYLVLKRTPAPGLPKRTSTDLRGF
jgi:cytidyltransferase-like protein